MRIARIVAQIRKAISQGDMNITPEISCVVSRAISRPKQMRQAIPFQANASQSIAAKSIIAKRSLSIEKKGCPG